MRRINAIVDEVLADIKSKRKEGGVRKFGEILDDSLIVTTGMQEALDNNDFEALSLFHERADSVNKELQEVAVAGWDMTEEERQKVQQASDMTNRLKKCFEKWIADAQEKLERLQQAQPKGGQREGEKEEAKEEG